jgi:hypothetical protein
MPIGGKHESIVNERDLTKLIRIAAACLDTSSIPATFREALVARSPLAALIDAMLLQRPESPVRGALERIAQLNQGTIEDLNASSFQSYLIYKADINEVELRRLIGEIELFRRSLAATAFEGPEQPGNSRGFSSQRVAASAAPWDKSDES